MYGNYYSKDDLLTFNCGDGGFDDGYSLCVLMGGGGDGIFRVLDTQQQGCIECAHQCQFWAQCTGVYYAFNSYPSKVAAWGACCIPEDEQNRSSKQKIPGTGSWPWVMKQKAKTIAMVKAKQAPPKSSRGKRN